MKYSELHRILRKNGCYEIPGETIAGHPAWYSPITGKKFATGHHRTHDVSETVLKNIRKCSGVKI